MAVRLSERPNRFGFSKNENRYVFDFTNPDAPGCALEVKLFMHAINSEAAPIQEVIVLKLYPDINSQVIFYVENYLRSYLQPSMPPPEANFYHLPHEQQLYYWVEFRQVTTAYPNNTWVTAERSRKRVLLLGGVEKEQFDRNNYFNYHSTEKKFMTWAPAVQMVGINQKLYISFLRMQTLSELNLYYKAVFTDGTEATGFTDVDPDDIGTSFLFHFTAGPGAGHLNLPALHPSKQLWYYELTAGSEADPDIAGAYRFYINYDHAYHYFDWMYINSLGGIDCIRIRGEYQVDVQRQSIETGKLAVMQQVAESNKMGERVINNSILEKVFKGDAGQLNTKAEQEALVELLSSSMVLEFKNNRRIRVTILNKNGLLSASDDTRWSFPLEWNYSYANEVHTPAAVLLPMGNSGNETYDGAFGLCAVPTGLSRSLISNSGGIATYDFLWNGTAGTYWLEYRRKISSEWIREVVTAAEFDGLQVPADGDIYEWRVKSICNAEETSEYVMGSDFTVPLAGGVCTVPSALSASTTAFPANQVTYQLDWAHSTENNFEVAYKKVTEASWTTVAITGASVHSITINADASEYQWRVRTNCGSSNFSGWVNGANFFAVNTSICASPFSLTVTRTGERQRRISWSHPGAILFLIRYRKIGAADWSDDSGSARYLDLTFPGNDRETWEWQVSAQCSPGNYSPYISGPNIAI